MLFSEGPGLRRRGVSMRFFSRMTVIRLCSAAAFCAALLSCNFNIDDDKGSFDPGPSVVWTNEILTKRAVELNRVFADGVLDSYEERYVKQGFEDAETRVIDQIKYFNAREELRYIELYSISDDGTVVRLFRYNAEGQLQFSKAFVHVDMGGKRKLAKSYLFGKDGLADSALAYEWAEPVAGTVKIGTVASFVPAEGADGSVMTPDSSVRWFFALDSKDWNLEVRRGSNPWSLGEGDEVSVPSAGADADADFAESGRAVLETSSDPVLVDLPVPPVGDATLELKTCRLAWKDAEGSSLITLEPVPADIPGGAVYRPVSAERKDRRLGNSTVATSFSYDGDGRVSAKETYYGNTLALRVALAYDAAGFPVSVDTTGAAMLVPLKYDIKWGDNHSLDRLDIVINDVRVQYFEFDYSTGDLPKPPLSVSGLRSFDVFDFGDGILEAVDATGVKIANYNGDDVLQQTFELSAIASGQSGYPGYKAEVMTAPTDDNPSVSNGWYQIGYNSGLATAIGAYKPDGTELWTQSFGYTEADVGAFIDSLGLPDKTDLKNFFGSIGELYETWVPADLADELEDVAAETASDPAGTLKKLGNEAAAAYSSIDKGAIRMLFDFLL